MPSDHFPPPPGYPAPPAVAPAEAAGPSYRAQGAQYPRSGLDRGTKRLVVVACGLGAALAAVAGGWAMMGGRDRPVPVFEADGRPLRVKPENPGGMQMPGLDEADGKAAMAPKTEAPSPQALRAQLPSNRPAAPNDPTPTAPLAVSPAAPPAAAVQPPPPATPRREAGEGDAGASRADKAAPAPTPPRTAAPAAAPGTAQAPAAASAAPASAALVQLAAVGSEQAAQAEWQRLSKRMPDLLGGRKPTVQRVDRDGRTLWRVRTGGFADLAEATSFCARVRAKGASCSIAAF